MYGLIVNVEFGPHTHPEGCICETVQTWMPQWRQFQNMAKSLSPTLFVYVQCTFYLLTLSHHQVHVLSMNCKQPLNELTVEVWLLYHHPNSKYCTL